MLSIPGLQLAVTGASGTANVRLAAMIIGAPVLAFIASWLLGRMHMLAKATMIASLFLIAVDCRQKHVAAGSGVHATAQRRNDSRYACHDSARSITQVADDLKARDAVLRQFPEVELVVGKAGRAETPTDPAPPDMVETVVNLRPEEFWPKRELHYDDAVRQTRHVLKEMEARGWVELPDDEERTNLVNDAAMRAITTFDETMRARSLHSFSAFQPTLGRRLVRLALDESLAMLQANGQLKKSIPDADLNAIIKVLESQYGPVLATGPELVTVTRFAERARDLLNDKGNVESGSNVLTIPKSALGELAEAGRAVLGQKRETFFTRLLRRLEQDYEERLD